MLTTIIIFIIVLSLLVFVHEWGHFWVARRFGVKAEEFGFGFPPRVAGIYKNKEGRWKMVRGRKEVEDAWDTIYSVNWIPLGGFVKIKGEDGENEEDKDSFVNQKIWKRASILSAGVTMNLVLAGILLSIGLMIGLPQAATTDFDDKAKVSEQQITVLQVTPDTPAEEVGLQMGDVIVDINGEKFASIEGVNDFVKNKEGQELNYTVKRGEEMKEFTITPEILKQTGEAGAGISIATTAIVKYPWYVAIWEGFKQTIMLTWAIIVALFGLLKGLVMGQSVGAEVGGPVKIAQLTGQFAGLGFAYLLQFVALLSINLAIINFLPIPALDGGRVLFLAIEKIKGSPVKREVEAVIHNISFIVLIILILLITFNDISRIIGG